MKMKNLTQEKQTINFERKMYYKNAQRKNNEPKPINVKRAEAFGHTKSPIEKYGLKQYLERECCDYDLIA